MALVDHIFRDLLGRNRTREVDFRAIVPLGATGAIAAGALTPGFTLTKTAAKTGRYDVQFVDSRGLPAVLPSALALVFGSCVVETLTADAAYTAAKAVMGIVRNNAVNTTGKFQIQMVRTDTFADAEAEDSAKLHISFSAKFTSILP